MIGGNVSVRKLVNEREKAHVFLIEIHPYYNTRGKKLNQRFFFSFILGNAPWHHRRPLGHVHGHQQIFQDFYATGKELFDVVLGKDDLERAEVFALRPARLFAENGHRGILV